MPTGQRGGATCSYGAGNRSGGVSSARLPAPAPATSTSTSNQQPATSNQCPVRLLFAEDDKQLLTAISRGLREAGHEVEPATTGGQALSLLQSGEYDAVILDVLLPGKSGIVVCKTVREAGNRVPILMLTALDAVDHRIAGLDAGAD